VKVRRSPQAVACRKRCVEELGRPHRLLLVGSAGVGYTANEARRGNLETGLCWNLSVGTESQLGRRGSTVEGKVRRMRMGSRIEHSTRRWGKPTTWGRTRREHVARKGNSSRTHVGPGKMSQPHCGE
jgi:hypothetical protein